MTPYQLGKQAAAIPPLQGGKFNPNRLGSTAPTGFNDRILGNTGAAKFKPRSLGSTATNKIRRVDQGSADVRPVTGGAVPGMQAGRNMFNQGK